MRIVAAVLFCFALASCSSPRTVEATLPPDTPSPSPSASPTPAPTPVRVTGTQMFQTPSHNIACVMSRTSGSPLFARCDIGDRTWKAPPKPKDCPLDYANGVMLEDGRKGQFTCAGDTVLNQGPVVSYGQRYTLGPIACQVEKPGVTCANPATKHGFFLSKASYRLF